MQRTGSIDEFFVRKWSAVLALQRRPEEDLRNEVLAIQMEARKRRHWETARDCDQFLCLAYGDEAFFQRLYFGTPFEDFRRQLSVDYGDEVTLADRYDWRLGGKGTHSEIPLLDVVAYGENPGGRGLPTVLFRLLRTLSSDFYRPARLGYLFSCLFPDEFYNCESAPVKVYQAIKRLRAWFRAKGVPLGIESQEGAYRLVAETPCWVRVPRPGQALDRHAISVEKLRREWPQGSFSLEQAKSALRVSASSALRILNKALSEGVIARSGSRAFTRYLFSTSGVTPGENLLPKARAKRS